MIDEYSMMKMIKLSSSIEKSKVEEVKGLKKGILNKKHQISREREKGSSK